MNETWIPRRCGPEYFERRQSELALLKTLPWQEQQGRGPHPAWLVWDEQEQMSVVRNSGGWVRPLAWFGVAISIAGTAAGIGFGIAIAWQAIKGAL